jgi:hypothetical protein
MKIRFRGTPEGYVPPVIPKRIAGHTIYVSWGVNAGGIMVEWTPLTKRLVLWRFVIGWIPLDLEQAFAAQDERCHALENKLYGD